MINAEINLLPKPFQASRLRRMYGWRLGKLLNRIYMLLIIVMILQVVIWLALNSIFRSVQEDSETAGAGAGVVAQVRELNQVLVGLEQATGGLAPWTVQVSEVLELVPSGMQVTGLEVVKGKNILVVTGKSGDRDAQVEFQGRLENLDWVQRVEAPLENFALGPDAGFSFSVYRN